MSVVVWGTGVGYPMHEYPNHFVILELRLL